MHTLVSIYFGELSTLTIRHIQTVLIPLIVSIETSINFVLVCHSKFNVQIVLNVLIFEFKYNCYAYCIDLNYFFNVFSYPSIRIAQNVIESSRSFSNFPKLDKYRNMEI